MSNLNIQVLNESAVRAILENDERVARANSAQSYWKTYMETLEGAIKNPDFRNTVFLHAAKSIAALNEATTTAQVASYNKMLTPTIISRIFPKAVAMQFIATRQLDTPTQIVQTFRLARENAKNTYPAGQEFMDPANYNSYPTTGTPSYRDPNGLLEANFSAQKFNEKFTSGASVTLPQTPVIPGTILIWEVSDTDPRVKAVKAVDPGVVGQPFKDASGAAITGSSVIGYGVLNGSAGSINTTNITPGAGKHLEIEAKIAHERNVTNLSSLTFKHDLISIATKSRKLTATVSAEAIQDLSAYSDGKLDALRELVAGMSDSAALELDAEIMQNLLDMAGTSTTYDHAMPNGQFRGTRFEKNQEFTHKINSMVNTLSAQFLRGADKQWGILSADTFSILQNMSEFKVDGDFGIGGVANIGQVKAVTNGHFTAAKALLGLPTNKVIVGVGGTDISNSALLYSPYTTLLTPPTADISGSGMGGGDIFSTKVGLMSRYAVTPLLDGKSAIGTIQVDNLYGTY